ncbi:MAG: VanW family protein [Polyangiales bacterium]
MTARRALLALVVVALASGTAWGAERHFLPSGRVLPGVRVEGFSVPEQEAKDDGALRAFLARRVDASLDRDIEITVGKAKRTVRLRDVVTADLDTTMLRTKGVGHAGGLAFRLDEALRARKGLIDVQVPLAIDEAALEKLATGLKQEVDEPPADAKLDLEKHTVVPDREGHALDVDGAVALLSTELLARALDGLRFDPAMKPPAAASVALSLATQTARVTAASLAKLDIGTVVGTFETHFGRGGDQAPRATNIENAAKKLDGLVLQPGELISFNSVVGERSEANGFKTAWEIFKGEMRPGVGGGTCQVASTFHAAAFFAGLDVLERLPHSRPSAYIPMGLDSTVVYPVVDLKLRNPHAFPVVVHTKVGANTLTIELLGKEKPVSVLFGRDVVDIYPYARKIEEEPWVKEGQAIKKQGGIRGYRVRRVRTMKYASGAPKTEVSYDFYPPTTEIYLVAPGTDPDALPALPDDVQEMIAKKKGEDPPAKTPDAVACAGECEGKTPLEIKNAAGVHDNVGDQANPAKSIAIGH